MTITMPSASFRHLILLFTFLTTVGCTRSCNQEQTPEKAVEDYLDVALNMNSLGDKDYLLALTTGPLKAAIATASEEVIQQAYINKHYKMKSYSVVERRDRTPRESEITFNLVYQDLGDKTTLAKNEANVATTQTENTVVVVRERDSWLIREVLGHKTTIDFPVSEDSIIRAAPQGK